MASSSVKSWEDLLELKDLKTAIGMCRSFGVDTKGIKTVDEAIDRLVQKWEQNNGSIQLTDSQKASGIEAALTGTRRTSEKLMDKYRSCIELYKRLHPKIQKGLQSVFPDVERTFIDRMQELNKGECTIVVAGEVGAGKSSLINLLLGTEILPTNALKCSNTISELRTSTDGRKEMIIQRRETLGTDGKWMKPEVERRSLSGLRAIKELGELITEADSEYEDNPYEKIEIYYPFQMLREGIVIVDTPGIEGGSNVVKRLEKYLAKAFGFIYVVNTNAAGGVQQGRLQSLLNMVVNSSDDFSPEASVFVCNKWEQVPDQDKAAVKVSILQKLQRVYPGVQESQIHYMSVKRSMTVFNKYNARIEQHKQLLYRIEHFIPNCLGQGLNSQYIWLSNYLKRSVYFLKVASANEAKSGEKFKEEYISLKQRMEKLKKDTDGKITELRHRIGYELHRIKKEIKEVLKSGPQLQSLCTWDPPDCPTNPKWKHLVEDASCLISERICRFIDSWEKQTGILKRIDEEIVRVFTVEFGLVEHQVKELEDILLKSRGVGQLFHTVKVVPVKSLWHIKKKNVQRSYHTLGGAVSNIGSLVASDREARKIFRKEYDRKKPEKMGEATAHFIKTILEHKDFDGKLEKFFSRFTKEIDTAAKRIPSFLRADENLIETLNEKIGYSDKVKQEFPLLIEECSNLLADLDIFYINRVMSWDYVIGDHGDLYWDKEKHLGSGAFAKVFEGNIKSKNRKVALKVFSTVVNHSNVTDVLTEDRIMRDLKHENLVRYYGASYVNKGDKGLCWVMVMELCSCSLKEIYINRNKDMAPGKFSEGDKRRNNSMETMAQYGKEIATALAYIHEKGYAHRDLKMENILLGKDGKLKLTDVGVAKPVNMITMTCAGSPAYMAPEVLLGNRNHDSKADIYSLAYVEWEMWYGCDLADMISEAVLCGNDSDAIQALKRDQEKGTNSYRPTFAKVHRPPHQWIQLMQMSWHHVPEERPKATVHIDFFQRELRELRSRAGQIAL